LYCRYNNDSPSLIIAPVKEELVYINPNIFIFHDVITKKQVEAFKQVAMSKVIKLNILTNLNDYNI
jgi:hypothetical protein